MKVTQLSTWDAACGIADYTANLCGGLAQIGVETDIVAIDRDELALLPRRELREYFDDIAARLEAAEVVHLQHEFGFFAGRYGYGTSVREFARLLRAVARPGRRVVTTFHTEPLSLRGNRGALDAAGRGAMMAAWRGLVAPQYNRRPNVSAIVHTRHARTGFVDSGVLAHTIDVIPHGMPEGRPVSETEAVEARAALGAGEDHIVLGVFGFLSAYKGHLTALRALRALPPRYRLLFIGGRHPQSGDHTLERVLSFVRRHPELEPRLTITGYQELDRARRSLAACDLLLAPYAPDVNLMASGALGQALASGRPVIGSAIPAFAELAREHGCLEPVPGTPNELALGIERLMADPRRREELIAAAGRYVVGHGWPQVAELHRRVYADAPVSTRSRRSPSSRGRSAPTRTPPTPRPPQPTAPHAATDQALSRAPGSLPPDR
jgi:glycosyltransferase involved in cell wall biosynthesis